MKTPQKVVWSEGLMMTPQHLQQADNYHDGLLAARLDAIEPNNWGLLRCDFDRKALNGGVIALEAFEALMPSGLAFGAEGGDVDLPPSRAVQEFFPHTQKLLEVYFGVAREREGVANYADKPGSRSRYHTTRKQVADLAQASGYADVDFARKNPVLLFGTEPRDDFDTIKIAELVRDESGGLVVLETYIPPILKLEASSHVLSQLRKLLNLMMARRRSLSEQRRERDASTIEFTASDVTRFLLLNTVNSFYPVMNHLASGGESSARECYMLLAQLAGQLSTFSIDFDPASIPRFSFTDLRSSLGVLFDQLAQLLQATVKEHHVAIPLEPRSDGMHIAQIKDERFSQCTQFLLAVNSSLTEQDVAQGLPRLAKIAGWADINGILASATPGASLEVTFRPPPEVPVKAGTVYFFIQSENAYWRNVVKDKNIAVYLPRPYDPTGTKVQVIGVIGRQVQKPFGT